jgi:hypothetical protein
LAAPHAHERQVAANTLLGLESDLGHGAIEPAAFAGVHRAGQADWADAAANARRINE